MSEKRFTFYYERGNEVVIEDNGKRLSNKKVVDLLNELNDECKFLTKQRDYWKQKYEKRTKTFTFPPNCDECDFLANNGICGYCKFTLNCYDSKEDLVNGEILPNCPLKPLINMNEQLKKQIQNYEQLISNSYVGEEETLDGFVGKYVIWENELQRYRKKNKNEMVDDE